MLASLALLCLNMAITRAYSLEDIDRQRYIDERDGSTKPAAMAPAENIIFRYIMRPWSNLDMAEDLLMHVADMRRRRDSLLAPPHYEMILKPVTGEGVVLDEVIPKYADEYGTVYSGRPTRFSCVNPPEDGYFMPDIDEWSVALSGILNVPRSRDLVPSGSR